MIRVMSIVLALPGFERFAGHLPAKQARETKDRRLGLIRHHRYAAWRGRTFDWGPLLASFHGSTGEMPGARAIKARLNVIDRGRKEGMVRAQGLISCDAAGTRYKLPRFLTSAVVI